jgi:hypothetical protein
MTKIVSFSLWGQDPKYCVGAIRNAELAAEIYPGWEVYIQMDYQVPVYVWRELGEMPHVHPVRRLDPIKKGMAKGDWRGMFWRFEYACADGIDVMISRDCDSRLSHREAAAVEEWLESGRGFHIMRDHPWHGSKMLGGMWGCRSFALPEFLDLMFAWNQEDRWQTDQDFLNTEIYPRVVNDAMIHASFFRMEEHAKDFPVPRNGTEFVGQIFDENETTVSEHIQALAKTL